MKISVVVKPNSKKEGVEKMDDGSYMVRVNVPPIEGRANVRVVELLAEHLGVRKSSFTLVAGHKSKKKIFEVS